MQVNPNPAMTPRIRLVSSAYAYLSKKADTANYALSTNITYVDSARISTNAYRLQGKDTIALSSKFVDEGQTNSISSGMIIDGNMTMSKINQSGATTGQVIKWTGSAWAPRNDSIGTGAGGPPTGPAGGDLTGTYPNPTIANNAVNATKILDNSISGSDLIKPCTLQANVPLMNSVLKIKNTGTGFGIRIDSAGGHGIFTNYVNGVGSYIKQTGSDGIVIEKAGWNGISIDTAENNGVHILRADDGVYVKRTIFDGFQVDTAGMYGVNIGRANTHGVLVGDAGNVGLYINKAGLDGIEVWRSNYDGLLIDSTGDDGVQVNRPINNGLHIRKAGFRGVQVDTSGNDGLYVANAGASGVVVTRANTMGMWINTAGTAGYVLSRAGTDGVNIFRAVNNGISIDSVANVGCYVNKSDTGFKSSNARHVGMNIDNAFYGIRINNANNYGTVYELIRLATRFISDGRPKESG